MERTKLDSKTSVAAEARKSSGGGRKSSQQKTGVRLQALATFQPRGLNTNYEFPP